MKVGSAATVMLTVLLAVCPKASVAVRVAVKVPDAVGVPLT